jgi:ring-1,2-phenylacetyl-CoA epoxidase subunit PaaE
MDATGCRSAAPSAAAESDPLPERTAFHRLRIADVDRLTDDSVAITFEMPERLRESFRYTQGQHVTVRADLAGQSVRRSYSICAPVSSGILRIAVKRIPEGVFSSYAVEQLEPGHELEVMTPTGRFFTELDPANVKHYAAVAGGSGITPVLSIVATTLEVEPHSRFTLLYGNRDAESIMFLQELAELQVKYGDRLRVLHFLERPAAGPLLGAVYTGLVDRKRLTDLLATTVPVDQIHEWFLCGPGAMTEGVRDTLLDHGAQAGNIHLELFRAPATESSPATAAGSAGGTALADGSAGDATVAPEASAAVTSSVTFIAGGRATTFERTSESEAILHGVLRTGRDVPYSCEEGVCGMCRAKLLEGTVEMAENYVLEDDQLEEGYVLTCQSRPTCPKVVVDYDA